MEDPGAGYEVLFSGKSPERRSVPSSVSSSVPSSVPSSQKVRQRGFEIDPQCQPIEENSFPGFDLLATPATAQKSDQLLT